MGAPFFGVNETYTPDGLIAGDFDIVTGGITVASGAGVLARGSVLGKVTASGKYVLATAAANDGSQNPSVILAENVDATSADVACEAYQTGEFTEGALTLGAGLTVDGIRAAMRALSIFFKKSR